MIFFLGLILGCDAPKKAPSPVAELQYSAEFEGFAKKYPLNTCKKYVEGSAGFSFCLYKNSELMNTIADLKSLCSLAGEWEGDCIYNWVTTKIAPDSGFDTIELVELCGSIPDCAFRVIDYRPDPDVVKHLKTCKKYVPKLFEDCSMHAMVNWWASEPSAKEVQRLLAEETDLGYSYAYYIAVRVHCDGVGECTGSKVHQRHCVKKVKEFQQGRRSCPKIERQRGGGFRVIQGSAP